MKPYTWSSFDRYQPVARIGRSIYVYDLTAADLGTSGSAGTR